MDETNFIVDSMQWSFSRLQSFANCKAEWFKHYVECEPSENNFFGEYGTLMHKILEKYAKDELSLFDLNEYFEEHYNEDIPHDAPPNNYVDIRQKYYDNGIEYIDNIDLDLNKYDVLGVEKEVHFAISDKDFVGIIDLLLRDKKTGDITIVDHKSASIKILKNGNVGKKDGEKFKGYMYQILLYSIPVLREYGRVDYMAWNFFKEQKWMVLPWLQSLQDEAIKWAEDTIAEIEKEREWAANPDFYYCHYLCGQRNNACEFKP